MSDATLHPYEKFVSQLTKHQPDLFAFVVSLMPGSADVADVLQNINMVLWSKREKFELGTSFIAWSFAVARYEVLNHLRRQSRHRHVLLDERLFDLVADEAPVVVARGDLRLNALRACLAKLRPPHRELLEHHYASPERLETFGRRVGRSAASLSVTLHRLRIALRKCVNARLRVEGGIS